MYQQTPKDSPNALQTDADIQALKLSLESYQAQLRQAQSKLEDSRLQVGQVQEEISHLHRWIQSKEALPQGSAATAITEVHLPEGDYVSPGLVRVKLDSCFPNMVIGNAAECPWPFLRREIPHNWYVDTRYPHVGFINRDEAHILYNSALKFQGKRGLEIGCWLGWSACHIALAGVELDVVDPMLAKPEFYESVSSSLKASGMANSVRLIPGYSPEKVEELVSQENCKWSFIFIDGNHDAPGPLSDAKLCEPLAEEDALILFHDLVAPDVAAGLEYLAKKGWNVMIYQTMQVMGVAWRGNVEPVFHQPDPNVCWQIPQHLQRYSGNLGLQVNQDGLQLAQSLARYQSELDWLRLKLQSSQFQVAELWDAKEWNVTELNKARSELVQLQNTFEQAQNDFSLSQTKLDQTQNDLAQTQTRAIEVQHKSDQLHTQLNAAQEALSLLQPRLAESEAAREQIHAEFLEAQCDLEQMRAQAEQSSTELSSIKYKLADDAEAFQVIQEKVTQLNSSIIAMKSSKFWKAREIWMKLKQSMGLKGD